MAAPTGIVRLRSRQLNYLYRTFKSLSCQENQVNLKKEEKIYLQNAKNPVTSRALEGTLLALNLRILFWISFFSIFVNSHNSFEICK